MDDSRRPATGLPSRGAPQSGSGAPCAEAQADGVPCHELIDCDDCDHTAMAAPATAPQPWEAPRA